MSDLSVKIWKWSVRGGKGAALMCAAVGMVGLRAQETAPRSASPAPVVVAGSEAEPGTQPVQLAAMAEPATPALPDAPGYSSSSDLTGAAASVNGLLVGAGGFSGGQVRQQTASRYSKVVLPGQVAPRLSVHDKVILGIRENIGYVPVGGWLISAGYEQATNGSPNYGQTGKGFAQRLGAAAARGTSENIFQDSVLASVLHEDPRYYKMGPGHNFITRLVYAGTRPIIGKTDGGRRTINFSDLGGDLAGAALTQAYYPQLNRGTTEVLKTFGGSVGGDALGFVVSEFLPGLLNSVHLTHNNQ